MKPTAPFRDKFSVFATNKVKHRCDVATGLTGVAPYELASAFALVAWRLHVARDVAALN
jgi:hypothetical protein